MDPSTSDSEEIAKTALEAASLLVAAVSVLRPRPLQAADELSGTALAIGLRGRKQLQACLRGDVDTFAVTELTRHSEKP